MSETYNGDGRADALNRLNGPSIALMILGVVGAASTFIGMIARVLGMGTSSTLAALQGMGGDNPELASALAALSGAVGIGFDLLGMVLAGVVVAGGFKMRTGEAYGLAVAAAVIALIPCTSPCCCCIGIPIGVWALVTLLDEQVKAAFR